MEAVLQMSKRLDGTYSGDILDKMVALSNKYARREIARLRGRAAWNAKKAGELFERYSVCGGGPGIPHEIEDFLQSL